VVAAGALFLLALGPVQAQVRPSRGPGTPLIRGGVGTNLAPTTVRQPISSAQPIQPLQPIAPLAPVTVTPQPAAPDEQAEPPAALDIPGPPIQPSTGRGFTRQILDLPPPGYRPPAIKAIIAEATNLIAAAASPEESEALYQVDPNGTDAGPGTREQPWATLQKAADTVKVGDTVIVNAGTYDGFDLRTSGAAGQPITFLAASPGAAVINSRNAKTPDAINLEGASYVVIDGFTVRDAERAGIRIVEATGVTIQNNVIGPNERWGIFTGFTPGVKILHNRAFGSRREHGIYVSNSRVAADQPVISGNECYDNARNGIQLNGDCTVGGDGVIAEALLAGNIVHDNGWKGLSLISMQQSTVQNNLIYGNGRAGIGAGGIHLTDELNCGKPSSDNVIVNNTVIEPRIAGLRITDGAQGNVVFNNIFVSRVPIANEVPGNRVDRDSNLTSAGRVDLFQNPAGGDFQPSADSAARGRGRGSFAGHSAPAQDLAGTWRTMRAPSAGAFE